MKMVLMVRRADGSPKINVFSRASVGCLLQLPPLTSQGSSVDEDGVDGVNSL